MLWHVEIPKILYPGGHWGTNNKRSFVSFEPWPLRINLRYITPRFFQKTEGRNYSFKMHTHMKEDLQRWLQAYYQLLLGRNFFGCPVVSLILTSMLHFKKSTNRLNTHLSIAI